MHSPLPLHFSTKHIPPKKSILYLDYCRKHLTAICPQISTLPMQVSECPSANRGGNLGTFKPGMMVKEFDEICFEKEVGVVHGPVETQFGAHLILITRRYEGEDIKK